MNAHVQTHSILAFVVSERDHRWMVGSECSDILLDQSYADFMEWNTKCIAELSAEERAWVWGLCQRIGQRSIKLMDMENCPVFTANGIYYSTDKSLCVVNPR